MSTTSCARSTTTCGAQPYDSKHAALDPATAQRHVLDRFGDATLVANAFATTASGGTAMPTRLTRTAGSFALIASIAWIAVAPAAL